MSATLRLYTRRMPMLRLLLPFTLGILSQWYWPLPITYLGVLALLLTLFLFIAGRLPLVQRFAKAAWIGGLLNVLLFTAGALITWKQDVRHASAWVGHHYHSGQPILLTLEEPLVEKTNSYKALASITYVYTKQDAVPVNGQVILYFKKDSVSSMLTYGSQIITGLPLQVIRNSGNPGSFDFQQYSLRQGTTHQLYLTAKHYKVLEHKEASAFRKILYTSRETIVNTLQTYIPGEKEQGLAEALLIGYKDDLDKKLVQSYSNTGVVHVIAISGLHLGIIYWLLLLLTRPLQRKSLLWLRFLFVVSGLWLFSLLAGAQPSVLRSAVMFTCLAFGTVLDRKGSIYNTLALSAFVLLCINPYWLWDVGFQLSYTAVLSILLFFKPIYNWCYFTNKIMDAIWKLAAVSLAAQLLTLPISIYYFHQFPLLFLFSNLVAVPLSSAILIGEVGLCALAFMPAVAKLCGQLLYHMIQWMNGYVEQLDAVSFAVWKNLYISPLQTILLYACIVSLGFWLMQKHRLGVRLALGSLLLFVVLRTLSFIDAERQRQLIVYNVPKHQAIDIIQGRQASFIGDSSLLQDVMAWNFHLQPSRVQHRIQDEKPVTQKAFALAKKQCLVVDTTIAFRSTITKQVVDVLILSKNPKLYLEQMTEVFDIRQIVLDGSIPRWKADLWKRSAAALHIPFYDVTEKGAFVMQF